MLKTFRSVSLATLLLITAGAEAARVITPDTLEGGEIITPQQLQQLSGTVHRFDMRKALNYAKGHMPGAVSLPFKPKSSKRVDFDASKDRLNFSKLPTDKGAMLLFYSDGPYGWKSYKAAVLAIRKGYGRVYWLRDGFSGWKKAGLPVER